MYKTEEFWENIENLETILESLDHGSELYKSQRLVIKELTKLRKEYLKSKEEEPSVKVYFESSSHAELVATFETEDMYNKCLPSLEKIAKESRMEVTETMGE